MKHDQEEIKKKLREILNREPEEREVINANKDVNIICEILSDKIESLEKRVTKLEP